MWDVIQAEKFILTANQRPPFGLRDYDVIDDVIKWLKSGKSYLLAITKKVVSKQPKVPALDLYKNSKSKNKNLPFF